MRRKIYLIPFLLLLSCSAPTEYVDEEGYLEKHEVVNGKWHGPGTKYFPSGELAATGYWKNGNKHGEFKEYFKNGNLSLESTYVNGIEQGIRKTYFETGELSATREITNGQVTGTYTKYFKNGNIENVAELVDNQLNGESILYDSLGNLLGKQIRIDGKILSAEEYYTNGQIKREGKTWNDGFIEKTYYPSGTHKQYIYMSNDTILYEKLFDEKGYIKGSMFPIALEKQGADMCVELEHTILPEDSLKIKVYLGDELSYDLVSPSNPNTYEAIGNTVCFPTNEQRIIKGYLCEVFKKNDSNQGCFPFAFDVINNKELNWRTLITK